MSFFAFIVKVQLLNTLSIFRRIELTVGGGIISENFLHNSCQFRQKVLSDKNDEDLLLFLMNFIQLLLHKNIAIVTPQTIFE